MERFGGGQEGARAEAARRGSERGAARAEAALPRRRADSRGTYLIRLGGGGLRGRSFLFQSDHGAVGEAGGAGPATARVVCFAFKS